MRRFLSLFDEACTQILATVIVLVAALVIADETLAQGHERWHQYYQHWKQPGTSISCCNARVNTFGVEHGDCEPTRYEMRNGEWYAWLRQESRWIHIPDDRLIRERNPSGEEGHLCWNQWTKQILCAVPPDTGG